MTGVGVGAAMIGRFGGVSEGAAGAEAVPSAVVASAVVAVGADSLAGGVASRVAGEPADARGGGS